MNQREIIDRILIRAIGKNDLELLKQELSIQGVVIKVCERILGGGYVGSYTRPETLYEVESLLEDQ